LSGVYLIYMAFRLLAACPSSGLSRLWNDSSVSIVFRVKPEQLTEDDDEYESQKPCLMQASHIKFNQNRKVETYYRYRHYLPHCVFSFSHYLQVTPDHVKWGHSGNIRKPCSLCQRLDWRESQCPRVQK
jgi:hypothetical protein